ncbi:MAG: hypothetical protein SFV15_01860 [Polyangiaceae bacterium]|nr:hypothetical protein [Polyangiaceae bacterium]
MAVEPAPEERAVAAWCQWLEALATDAQAALSASLAYEQLEGSLRDGWLDALIQDRHRIQVPLIAVYAPLLAVEKDPERRARIHASIGPAEWAVPCASARALWGRTAQSRRVGVIISPLYLDFVQVLSCSWQAKQGFDWVRHEPFLERTRAPGPGSLFEGVRLESTPLRGMIDELSYAILAHQRQGLPLPEELRTHASLFHARPASAAHAT